MDFLDGFKHRQILVNIADGREFDEIKFHGGYVDNHDPFIECSQPEMGLLRPAPMQMYSKKKEQSPVWEDCSFTSDSSKN